MNIQEIKSAEWGISLNGFGEVVQGKDDINQCIMIIVRTIRGTDPFRPLFGCDLYQFIDQPQAIAGPGMAKEIANAVNLWEPRVEVKKVSYLIEEKKIIFSVDWELIGVINDGGTMVVPFDFEPTGNSGGGNGPGFKTVFLSTEENDIFETQENELIVI